MASQRTFTLINGMTVEKIGEHLVDWFQMSKNMIAEGGRAQGGSYFVQARDQDDGWKKISGLTKAIQVQLIKAENNVIVSCDFGKWSDKVGAGALGFFLFAPLAATAAYGAVKQSHLPEEIFTEIEKFIMYGGSSVVVSMGGRLKDDEIDCPVCKAKNPKGQKFCKECGAKLGRSCPNCGAEIDNSVKFCPECGSSVESVSKCIKCGKPLSGGVKFCQFCGAKQENVCPQCGAVVELGIAFCPACGAKMSGKKLCVQCKSELQPGEKFCKVCGTKVEDA